MKARILLISITVIAVITVGVLLTVYLTYDPYNPVEKIACENKVTFGKWATEKQTRHA